MNKECPNYFAVPEEVEPVQSLLVEGECYYDGASRMTLKERLEVYNGDSGWGRTEV